MHQRKGPGTIPIKDRGKVAEFDFCQLFLIRKNHKVHSRSTGLLTIVQAEEQDTH